MVRNILHDHRASADKAIFADPYSLDNSTSSTNPRPFSDFYAATKGTMGSDMDKISYYDIVIHRCARIDDAVTTDPCPCLHNGTSHNDGTFTYGDIGSNYGFLVNCRNE